MTLIDKVVESSLGASALICGPEGNDLNGKMSGTGTNTSSDQKEKEGEV